jgi:hypothetical protein
MRFPSEFSSARSWLPPGRRDDGTIDDATARRLAATVRELANYAAAALVFGQFVGERSISWWLILVGMTLWFAFVGASLFVEGE